MTAIIEANILSCSGVIKELEKLRGCGTWRGLAERIGCSATNLSDVLHGHRQPGQKILEFMGLRAETVYVRAEQGE